MKAYPTPVGSSELSDSRLIDRFIPRSDHGGLHEAMVRAPADLVFDVAWNLDLRAHPAVRAIFWLREKLLGGTPGPASQLKGLVPETMSLGWGVLAHRPGRELVVGAVTQPWQANVVFRALPAQEFAAFAAPDFVKIVWTLEAEPIGPALTRFRTETRALPTDEDARRKFDRYWRFAGIGIHLIRVLTLPAVRRQSERRYVRQSGRAKAD
ncbi:MAG: hypothetical protein WD942_10840 [Dehalococcoidia bacterium]